MEKEIKRFFLYVVVVVVVDAVVVDGEKGQFGRIRLRDFHEFLR